MEILEYSLFNVPVLEWIYVFVGSISLGGVLVVLRRFISGHFKKLADGTYNVIDDLIALLVKETKLYTFFSVSAALLVWFRRFPSEITDVVYQAAFLILLFQIGIWGKTSINWWVDYYHKQRINEDPGSVTTIRGVALIAHLALWSILALLTLENLGVDVTALLTGLGIGGIAVALAVQNILGDLFASLSIMLDKPFVIGDFLIIGDHMGTVEDIGLKTTRIRSLSGEQIVISNGDLLKSRIRNYKRMYERRVVFSVGVEYETPQNALSSIPGTIRGIVESNKNVRFDRAHFKSFGDFALIFEVVYYVENPDYGLYMDIQQSINLEIIDRFESEGIQIAYPTQKLLVDVSSIEKE